jgi:hypothetical protein
MRRIFVPQGRYLSVSQEALVFFSLLQRILTLKNACRQYLIFGQLDILLANIYYRMHSRF